jgi:chromosome segregation ATPase
MNARAQTAVLAALLACLPLALAPAWAATPSGKWGGKTYKWVDEQGVTHYGDSVPPEYAQQSRTELNRAGLEIGQVARQLNGEEAAAAQKAAQEQQKLRQHDSFLMTTYTSAKDIEQLRDERLALLNGQMDIARGSIDSTNQRLTSLEERMRNFKPWSETSTRRMPDQLAEEVVRTLQERNSLQAALAAREKERKDMRAQFESDLSRYRFLTEGPRRQPGASDSLATR